MTDLDALPEAGLVLMDSAPIIYVLEQHPTLRLRFRPFFEAQRSGRIRIAITTIVLSEVLVGPLRRGDEALENRYRLTLLSWPLVPLDLEIAERAARVRASYGLKLPDAIQIASALAINADALVTHDRDFSRVKGLRIIS